MRRSTVLMLLTGLAVASIAAAVMMYRMQSSRTLFSMVTSEPEELMCVSLPDALNSPLIAQPPTPTPSEALLSDAAVIAKQTGLSLDAVLQQDSFSNDIGRLGQFFRGDGGPDVPNPTTMNQVFAGIWVEHAPVFRVTAAFKSINGVADLAGKCRQIASRFNRALLEYVRVKRVKYALAELISAQQWAMQFAQTKPGLCLASSVDEMNNKLAVSSTTQLDPAEVLAAINTHLSNDRKLGLDALEIGVGGCVTLN